MNESRYASLSSGLLARKGSAKPAMRPQGFQSLEDLGWNDMGFEAGEEPAPEEHVPSSITALTPSPRHAPRDEEEDEDEIAGEAPEIANDVAVQQRKLHDSFDTVPEAPPVLPARIVALPVIPAARSGRKTAFTLRLDAERHLRLRLACTVAGRSAQAIVTEALDRALAENPEIEALAARAERN